MKKGILITLEGIDGSGKTTLAAELARQLRQRGSQVLSLREPGGVAVSEKIRALLLDPENRMSGKTETFLYAAARAELVETVISPALSEGKIVLLDRYTDSTLTYQGYGKGVSLDFVRELNDLATGGIQPDVTFLLNISPEEALERRNARAEKADRMELEGDSFQRRVYEGYLALAESEKPRMVPLDATKTTRELLTEALAYIEKRILK